MKRSARSAVGVAFSFDVTAQYPAGSGVGVSVLVRQPHGFEGFGVTRVEEHANELSVSQFEQPTHRLFDFDAARPAFEIYRTQSQYPVAAQVTKIVRPHLKLAKLLLDLRSPCPDAFRPSIWLAAE
jgi:hypothetical protein